MTELVKRSQLERLTIVESLLVSIMEEFEYGEMEDILQNAVNCQIEINRIVWELNMQMEKDDDTE